MLETILRDGLGLIHRHLTPIVLCERYPIQYRTLIQNQNAIGWGQLYRGRWCREWARLHTAYTTAHHWQAEFCNGDNWVRTCGQFLLEQWIKLWNIRNNERHGADEKAKQAKLQATISQQLEYYYAQQHTVLPADRPVLFPYENAMSHLQRQTNLEQLQEWILENLPRIQGSAAQAIQLHRLGNRDIRDWLISPLANPDQSVQ